MAYRKKLDYETNSTGLAANHSLLDSEEAAKESALGWLEVALPRLMRRLMDTENLNLPLLQLPLAQLRLAQSLYSEEEMAEMTATGETMGRLSLRLGVRQNALTQAADRLVNHGLAERLNDPTDRRIVRLRLTAQGREWVRERRVRRHDHLAALWNALNDEERLDFLRCVDRLDTIAAKLEDNRTSNSASNSDGKTKSKESTGSQPIKTGHSEAFQTLEETLSRFTAGAANGAAAKIG